MIDQLRRWRTLRKQNSKKFRQTQSLSYGPRRFKRGVRGGAKTKSVRLLILMKKVIFSSKLVAQHFSAVTGGNFNYNGATFKFRNRKMVCQGWKN